MMHDESEVDKALEALRSRNPYERLTAIETLAKHRYADATEPLIALATRDEQEDVREAAVWSMGDIAAPEAVDFLVGLADDPAEPRGMRWAAIHGLGMIAAMDALPRVFHLYYADDDMLLRQAAGRAILRYGERATSTLTDILTNRRSRGIEARAAAAQMLGRIGAQQAVPLLVDAAKNDEPMVQWDAVKALGDIGSPAGVPFLIELLAGDNVLMGKIAVWALETISTADAIAAASRWREENEYYHDDPSDQPPLLPPPRPDSYGPF